GLTECCSLDVASSAGAHYSLRVSVFFFFQAEDGIRDDLVTGVQTCALPIFGNGFCGVTENFCALIASEKGRPPAVCRSDWFETRSEERRVGKECRSGWASGR